MGRFSCKIQRVHQNLNAVLTGRKSPQHHDIDSLVTRESSPPIVSLADRCVSDGCGMSPACLRRRRQAAARLLSAPSPLFPRAPGRPKSIIRQNRHTDFSEIKDQHRLGGDNAVRAARRRRPRAPRRRLQPKRNVTRKKYNHKAHDAR